MVDMMARPKECFIESGRLDEANLSNLGGLGYGL